MKILCIITQSEIGGAQRFLLEFAPYLVSRGHEVVVAAGEGDEKLFARRIPNLVRNLNPIKDIAALCAILKTIKKEKPDILFLQSTKAGFLGSLAAKLYALLAANHKLSVVYRIGGWAFRDPRPWWMNKILFWMEKISAPWKDAIIVNSEVDRQIAIDRKIASGGKITKIYNGIDINTLKFLKKEDARKIILGKERGMGGEVVIGTIANLYATKGIEYLIEAAYLLSAHYSLPTINYIVIGEGKERPKLATLIEKYNLAEKFFLIGHIANAAQYLKAFDVFVLPSVKEGFPWVLLEAMAAEVPIIATKVGAVPEIIEDEKEGLLVPPKDGAMLAEKISKLLLPPFPRPARLLDEQAGIGEQMVGDAREKPKQFSLQKMLRETEEIILGIKN